MPKFNKNEADWFHEHIQPHEDLLRSWLNKRFSILDSVEDIIQESYIRTVKRNRINPLKSPKAFLFSTAHNLSVDIIRRKRIVQFESLAEETTPYASNTKSIPDKLIQQEELNILNEAIQALPKKCRRVFTLRKVYGMSLKQIAEELGVSVKTVETQISIGIRKCNKFYMELQ